MSKPEFNIFWSRIVNHEGQRFETKTGLPFTYQIRGELLVPSRANQTLPKSHFEHAYEMAPFDGPGDITKELRGPAYIWATLYDRCYGSGEASAGFSSDRLLVDGRLWSGNSPRASRIQGKTVFADP
jgi:hypothetical protein